MKKTLVSILSATTLMMAITGCANQGAPGGGPEDLTPPKLIETIPANETLNFDGEEITLTFDEWVTVEQLGSQLIVSPRLGKTPTYRIKKNSVIIELQEPLQDSTTYVFNFREAIKDITKGNAAVNLTLSISTGNFIDSMQVNGMVMNYFENEPLADATVGLYPKGDTLDLFTGQPTYFATTDGSGHFKIQNIRAGDYSIFAWKDENSNLMANARNEAYGFLTDTISLRGDSIGPITILTQSVDTQPLKVNSSRPSGQYYQVTYNKPLTKYSIDYLNREETVPYNLVDDKKVIRFYKPIPKDSIGVIITAYDTLMQTQVDTFHVKFIESQRPAANFTITTNPKTSTQVAQENVMKFTFSKPVATTLQDSIYWQLDSTTRIQATINPTAWNASKDIWDLSIPLPDSVTKTSYEQSDTLHQNPIAERIPLTGSITLILPFGTFISVEGDTLAKTEVALQKINPEETATIRGKLNSPYTNHTIQLIKDGAIAREISAVTNYEFKNVIPGDYKLRVLVDKDGDGIWEPGNILTNTEPEPVFFYPDQITLRANWERSDVDLTLQ